MAEELTASGRLFQTVVSAADKALPPMLAQTVREMTTRSGVTAACRCQRLAADGMTME